MDYIYAGDWSNRGRPVECREKVDIASVSEWIEALEGVPALLVPGLVYLQHIANNKEVLETLMEWAVEGLNLDNAITQPETAYKVRHLKMGVRLVDALCCSNSDISLQLMQKDVQHRLLDLYSSQYMSSSLKLHIVRALDSTMRFVDGLQWFFSQHLLQEATSGRDDLPMLATVKTEMSDGCNDDDNTVTARPTAYQRLLEVMMKKETVRTMAALTALLQKAHIYEVLVRLETTAQEISEYSLVPDTAKHSSNDENEIVAMETELEVPIMPENIAEEDFDIIINCLEEISKVIENADNLITQPKRSLPNKVFFCVKQRPHDPYPGLYHLFNACHLLECIFVILSSPATCTHASTFVMVRELMSQMLHQQSSLLYLSSQPDTTNGIVRVLAQNGLGLLSFMAT
ncbi:hypothetical protein LSAT2_028704 [Lamellibrachia satsuma]|nr:hypothetical protein LSAT2_028704 [Lamellibrachia satsuma]